MILNNPHKRIEEIDKELKPLEEKEQYYKNKRLTSKQWKEMRAYEEVKSSIFFLVIEREIIRKTIKYFKGEFNKIEKKYPEHYWRWQFFAKILNPDKIIEEIKNARRR